MRKAVAVPYVIALILGVAVIALIGIWVVMSGGKLGKQSLETQCQAKALEICIKQDGTGSATLPPELKCPATGIETNCVNLIK